MARVGDTLTSGSTFDEHVPIVLARVRRAFSDVLATTTVDPSNGLAMARHFGVDKTLAWRISKLVCSDDLIGSVSGFPGRSALESFLRGAQGAGAAAAAVAGARQAIDELEELVDVHSGDRETFEMMVGEIGAVRDPKTAEAYRRLAYRGNRAIWGVQARVQVCAQFVAPNKQDSTRVDVAMVSGLVDFRRLREEVAWPIASLRHFADDGSPLNLQRPQPLDPKFPDRDETPLLGAFCSQPIPEMQVVARPKGQFRYEIPAGPVGRTAAVTAMSGWYYSAAESRYRTPTDALAVLLVQLRTPVELLIFDVYTHAEMIGNRLPRASLHSQLPGGDVYPDDGLQCAPLALTEEVARLPRNPQDALTFEVPNYAHLIRYVADRMQWKTADFQGFRLKLKYPPIPAAAAFEYDLEERPT